MVPPAEVATARRKVVGSAVIRQVVEGSAVLRQVVVGSERRPEPLPLEALSGRHLPLPAGTLNPRLSPRTAPLLVAVCRPSSRRWSTSGR